jgi:DNA excision repair protein ERCC-2
MSDNRPTLRLSVRNFVEFVLRSGDLSAAFRGTSRMVDGTRFHQVVQYARVEECPEGAHYTPEVTVSYAVDRDDIALELNGRIDGIYEDENGIVIEEIKTTGEDLSNLREDRNPVYWAQARVYAFIFAEQNDIVDIDVQLTYYQADTGETKAFRKHFIRPDLKLFFDALLEKHLEWAETLQEWADSRDVSIKGLRFPFTAYRKGQRELAVTVYRAIKQGSQVFAQAPTGIGKTMATLFPAIKSMGEGFTSKIFYLTAKTITRTVAENTLAAFKKAGLNLKTITITAKDKTCFLPDAQCEPEECPFAKGYYDRLNEALRDIYQLETFTRPVIEEYARKHRICPFEFSLDLSLWADCIVCDYNYVFDPRVYLRRYFSEESGLSGEKYTFLIDEAHNLVDRSREMFSAEFFRKPVFELRRSLAPKGKKKNLPPRLKRLDAALGKINTFMTKAKKGCGDDGRYEALSYRIVKEAPAELLSPIRGFLTIADKILSDDEDLPFREALLDLFFKAHSFQRTAEYFDERYVTCYESSKDDMKVKLFCIDPSYLLKETLKRGNAAIFFSATLTPVEYFVEVLGGNEEAVQMQLASPFPKQHLLVMVDDKTSTKYKERALTYDRVAAAVGAMAGGKIGNYLVYFPSYKYMNEIHQRFTALYPEVKNIIQKDKMTEPEREYFLNEFSTYGEETLMGFAVMGGVFGEGIDLVGERLSGVVIVGVGLPQISLERDIVRDYYKALRGSGFEFAYTYPGMNKVLQAVGRLIRTETDRGAALLIDERFAAPLYWHLFPPDWHPVHRVKDADNVLGVVRNFWEKNKI